MKVIFNLDSLVYESTIYFYEIIDLPSCYIFFWPIQLTMFRFKFNFLYILYAIKVTTNYAWRIIIWNKSRLTGSRILNADEYKIEHSLTHEGKLKDIEITILGAFWAIPTGKNVIYGEGQGIITTKDGEATASFREYRIGHSKGQVGASFRGSVFYKSSISTNGKLSFLNDKIGVFETEINESGISTEKVWEWK